MWSGASTVKEVCVTGTMRTTPSLSMRDSTQTVPSSEVPFLKKVKWIIKYILLN